jgi:hypothetical protein
MIRSRAVWFFTPSNPKITFGGLEGEPKKEMYALLPTSLYPPTFLADPAMNIDALRAGMLQAGIQYPFIVKPEVGWQGVLLRKIDNEEELMRYHHAVQDEYIIQQLVTYPMEVSVFYIRHPREAKGRVTGFLQKVPMQVQGNGIDTLSELIHKHPKGLLRLEEMKMRHRHQWDRVIPAGETYMLSYAANHNRGARFIDLKAHIDDRLAAVFDPLSLSINDFFYGRYDIMCRSVDDLKSGEHFTILEYNGCGAEPNHFYDTGYTLLGAYREILMHWKWLYKISAYNKSTGIKPWPFMKGLRFIKESRKCLERMKAIDRTLDGI